MHDWRAWCPALDGNSGWNELAEIERVGRGGETDLCAGHPRCDDARLRTARVALFCRARRSLAIRCWHDLPKMINLIELTDLTNMAGVPTAEPAMETIAAADAKTNFGALLDKAQRGPVMISKNGRAVAVVMSADAYSEQQQLKLEVLATRDPKGPGRREARQGGTSRERAFAAVDRELKKLRKK